jgi:hypothetical protein
MSSHRTLKREVRVAFSPRSQAVWFRLLKWAIAIGASVALWRTPYFWWWIGAAISLGVVVHFIWRWKTKGWTQPWGGWTDVAAARDD